MQTEEYARMRQSEDTYWWFISRRRLAQELLKEFAPEGPVLDLGCGTGALLSELQPARDVTGADFSPHAIEFARERGLQNLVQADAQALPFPDELFQAVISLDTLEHVPDDEQAMREIFRVLKPGGVAILNVPAYQWLWGPHDVALMHQRRYTRQMFTERLERAGLAVQWSSYGIFFLFPLVLMIRLRDKLRRGPAKVSLPAAPGQLNDWLIRLQDFEAQIMRRRPLPWGSSITVVVQRPLPKEPPDAVRTR